MKKKNVEAELERLKMDAHDMSCSVCHDIAELRERTEELKDETDCQEEVQSDNDKRIRELEDTTKDSDKVLGDLHSRIDRLEYALYGMKNILVEKLDGETQ
jgi:predicted site-specific integrase-resolvase